jgi:hypothetical protein
MRAALVAVFMYRNPYICCQQTWLSGEETVARVVLFFFFFFARDVLANLQ